MQFMVGWNTWNTKYKILNNTKMNLEESSPIWCENDVNQWSNMLYLVPLHLTFLDLPKNLSQYPTILGAVS